MRLAPVASVRDDHSALRRTRDSTDKNSTVLMEKDATAQTEKEDREAEICALRQGPTGEDDPGSDWDRPTYTSLRTTPVTPRYGLVAKAGLCLELSTPTASPVKSPASTRDMYFEKEGRARKDASAHDVFEVLMLVSKHVKSPTRARVPSKHRAALWNLWIAFERGPAFELRQTVAQAMLDVADAVLMATNKGNRDSITVWVVVQLILNLSRYSITYHRPRPRPKMDGSKIDDWEPLMFLAQAELQAMDEGRLFKRLEWAKAMATRRPNEVLLCGCLDEGRQSTLIILHPKKSDELTFMTVAEENWSIWFTTVEACYLFPESWSMFLALEKHDVASTTRMLKFDEVEWADREQRTFYFLLRA